MSADKNADALSEVATMRDAPPAEDHLPDLPEGWVPDDTVIFGVASRDEDGRWEVVLPMYTVVGVGESMHDAVHEAGELLDDYLRMCFAEGKSFEDSVRPIPMRWAAPLIARSFAWTALNTLHHKRQQRRYRLRLPFNHATC